MKFGSLMVCPVALLVGVAAAAQGPQQPIPIGTVGVQDATVAGALEITNGRAVLVGSTTVTAHDHAAEIALSRGGTVRVCATSGLHLAEGNASSQAGTEVRPLMLGLDRGAIEIATAATSRDVVMTPDLRFVTEGDGPLDLRLRVTRNGDTCVENRGVKAPVLHISDPFGGGSYDLLAGQHVLFEHASLKEVVDHESSSCGCPADAPVPAEPTMTVADALLHPAGAGASDSGPESGAGASAKTAEEQHPFPAAVSEGLAPAAAVPQAASGARHSQVSATLSSSGTPDSTADAPVPSSTSSVAAGQGTGAAQVSSSGVGQGAAAAPAAVAAPKKGVLHAVGRFFHRLFGGGPEHAKAHAWGFAAPATDGFAALQSKSCGPVA